MNPDTIQFQCGFCRTILTVPAQMAGVTGPCPSCGQTVTSPTPAPAMVQTPQWSPAPVAVQAPAAAPPAWPPAPQAPTMGEVAGMSMPGMGMPGPVSNTGLPPKRAPGQPPLSATLNSPAGQTPWSTAPGAAPSLGSLDVPAGISGGGLPNHSRLIPGSPSLPTMTPLSGAGGMLGMPGMPPSLSGSSLLGREVSHAPASPVTQPLQALGAPPLSLGGAFGHDSSSVAPVPAGRSIASLRAPRGTNFIRLAFAAVFLLGFLGLVGFLLKDYLPGMFPSLLGHEIAEEVSKEDPSLTAEAHPISSPTPGASSPLTDGASSAADKTAPQASSAASQPKPTPIVVGFDPQEPVMPKADQPAPATVAAASPPSSFSERSALPVDSPPSPRAAGSGALLEVPATPTMNAQSPGAQTTSPAGLTESHSIEEDDAPPAAKPAAEALKKFLSAKSLAERLSYTLGADLMKPLMERYYGRAPDGPILVDRIQFVRMDPNPELGSGKHCIFSLENKTWEFSVPVMLEEKPDGFKVDWVSFVEFKDRLLEKFFQTYQEGEPCFFHVGILRSHYFKDDVPNLEHKDVFRVSPAPPNSFQDTVFLDKTSELAQKLRSQLPWETHVWAVVGLQWKKLGSQQWVELTSVPQMHWYSLPMTSHSVSTPQKVVEAQDMPPGISKNGVGGKSRGGSSSNMPPPGIRKSTPDLPPTIKRPLPAGR